MKHPIIGRKTAEEIKHNSRLIEDFIVAFMASDVSRIGELLHPSGEFFGRFNKNKALAYFHRIFFDKDGIQFKPYFHINVGISLHPLPGAEVIEIRCAEDDVKNNFGDKEDALIGERVFYFCFSFIGRKIFSIEHPKNMQKQREYLVRNN